MTTIFISYRRSDSQERARRLYDRMVKDFGRDNVFFDIHSIQPGSDFRAVLDNVLSQSRIVLVVIGPDWANTTDRDGANRLYDRKDFVRLEVEAALQRKVPVVPVLVGGAALPDALQLPETLRGLCYREARKVGDKTRFDGDVERLVRELNRVLAGGLTELPAEGLGRPAKEDETKVVGHDWQWASITQLIATGSSKLVVLVGESGIGKTVTALELARRQTPEDPGGRQHILQIDAPKEFHEASLAEKVGEAYPDEFCRDHDGAPISALSFGAQRRDAAGLLRKKGATVILDGPGEAPYPRDAAAELELALQVAKELSAQSVLVLVTTRNETWWAGCHPTRLRGLSPENARALFRSEFLRSSTSSSPDDDLAKLLDGEGALRKRIEQGRPREVIDAAHQAAVGASAKEETSPGALGRMVNSIHRAAAALLGDPVLLQPRAPAAQSAGSGPLVVVCVVLLVASLLSLIAAYESHSVLWARMFDQLSARESQVPSLAVAAANAGGPTLGLLVEFARAFIIIFGFLFVVVGKFLGKEAAALLPHSPWARLGRRRLDLRAVFRVFLLGLAAWLGYDVFIQRPAHPLDVQRQPVPAGRLERQRSGDDEATSRAARGGPGSDERRAAARGGAGLCGLLVAMRAAVSTLLRLLVHHVRNRGADGAHRLLLHGRFVDGQPPARPAKTDQRTRGRRRSGGQDRQPRAILQGDLCRGRQSVSGFSDGPVGRLGVPPVV